MSTLPRSMCCDINFFIICTPQLSLYKYFFRQNQSCYLVFWSHFYLTISAIPDVNVLLLKHGSLSQRFVSVDCDALMQALLSHVYSHFECRRTYVLWRPKWEYTWLSYAHITSGSNQTQMPEKTICHPKQRFWSHVLYCRGEWQYQET